RYAARLTTVVVLPTPPFWFAQAMTSPTIRRTDRVALQTCYLESPPDSDLAPLPAYAQQAAKPGLSARLVLMAGHEGLAGAMA
ncbi:MAG TPA: hypothetical protein VFF55_08685, partial [Candidatus Deferrimicrobium sp.]|nr:hypothetical protein [Candidatus Deferrimicrobium sp.]